MEAKSLKDRLKRINNIVRCSKGNGLYDACLKAKKVCFDRLEKYDNDIEALYTCKITLLIEKDIIGKEYLIVQDQLIIQRALYNQLKEECELNAKEAFLIKFECFRRNRAAKIIQRNWRFYRVRAVLKKRKGRK